MKTNLLIVNKDLAESEELCTLLTKEGYQTEAVTLLDELRSRLATESCMAVVMDLDSVQVENRTIRDLVLATPGVPFLCTSRDRFHPELKDAICYHIFACLTKPVDPDELLYWLRCIRDDQKPD
jgi:DNA-binding NtrC family response regulator